MTTDVSVNASHLYQIIRESASAVASEIYGKAVNGEESNRETSPTVLVSAFLVSNSAEGLLRFELSKEACESIAVLLLGGSEDRLTEQTREAAEEFLRQVVGIVATSMRPHFGTVELKPYSSTKDFIGDSGHALTLKAEGFEFSMSVRLSDDLISSLNAASTATTATNSDEKQTITAAVLNAPAENTKLNDCGTPTENLDLVLDAELHVSIRFGRREMLLKDILELTSGSVVELDRAVSEPVDLIVDKRVFARGEVVIVDGNYGLHITEVAAPQQRIECLQ